MAEKRLKAPQRKEEIIKAAIKVVARNNFDKATVSEIAREGRVNEALIYQHFEGKNDLMLSLLDYIKDKLFLAMLSTPGLQDPRLSSLREAGMNYYASAKMDTDMLKCILCATSAIDGLLKEKAIQLIKVFQQFIAGRIDIAMKNGYVDPSFDREILAWGILGTSWMASMLIALGQPELMPPEKMNKVYEKMEELIKPA